MRHFPAAALAASLLSAACQQRGVEPALEGRPLGEVLRDANSQDDSRKQRAVDSLRRSGTNALPVLVQLLRTKPDTSEELRKSGGKPRPALLPSLNDTPPATRRAYALSAFVALGTNAAPALPSLVALMQTPENSSVAAMAISRLGLEGVSALINTLASSEPRVRSGAASAVLALGPGEQGCLPILLNALTSSNTLTRATAAAAIGKVSRDSEQGVSALVPLIHDPQLDVRLGAVTALGNIGAKAELSVPLLVVAARDKSSEAMRLASAAALWRISPATARREGIENPITATGDGAGRSRLDK